MNDPTDLINGYFDGLLSEAQLVELNAWLKEAPANVSLLAEFARLHDHLRSVVQSNTALTTPTPPPATTSRVRRRVRSRRLWPISIFSLAVVLAVAVLIAYWLHTPVELSAAEELNRLIDQVADHRDRTYVIHNLDDKPEASDERRPPLDGAKLYVRFPEQYVLIRKFPDGRTFVTGCDGEHSWAIPPNGAVRVSGDLLRFRGPVPGHQHGIPFVNLRSDLVQLRDAYDISLLGGAAGQRGLLAQKKSAEHRGPNRVELWYDPTTGVIQRMVFSGMPKARGGPDHVAVELLEQRDLGNDFFRHKTHHDANRRVVEED